MATIDNQLIYEQYVSCIIREAVDLSNPEIGGVLKLTLDGQPAEFKIAGEPGVAGDGSAIATVEPLQQYVHFKNIALTPGGGPPIDPVTSYEPGTSYQINLGELEKGGMVNEYIPPAAGTSAAAGGEEGDPTGAGSGVAAAADDAESWKGPVGAAQKYGHDLISQKGAQASAKSNLGKLFGGKFDQWAHQAIGIPTKKAVGPSVYAKGGPGGVAHGQRAKVGHAELDAPVDTRHPAKRV